MKNQNNTEQSGYRIENLLLLESTFKRDLTVTFNDPKVEQVLNVDVNVQVKDDLVLVTEKVDYGYLFDKQQQATCSITMMGVFRKTGESPLEDLEKFGYINGAAIIFPYIREHLTSLAAKAGMGLVILPPVNFVKVREDQLKAQQKS